MCHDKASLTGQKRSFIIVDELKTQRSQYLTIVSLYLVLSIHFVKHTITWLKQRELSNCNQRYCN